jgi:nitroreductase
MKKIFFAICTFLSIGLVILSSLEAQENGEIRTILNHYGARNFIAGAVSRNDLDLIIQAGIRAPSASNRQPWHFTVVQNQALARRIISHHFLAL